LLKFGLPSPLNRLFKTKNLTNTQSTTVDGVRNTVNQSVNHFYLTDRDSPLVREILDSVQEGGASTDVKSFAEDNLEDDDRPEIQRILEYRKIAQDGNGATAIALLEKLKSDAPYGSGYFAFRLNLNIGVIQQNIGDYPSAAASLKAAHEFFPEHHKAQTALAFAELLDGKDQAALERTTELLNHDGDHRNLAACILCHAARNLNEEIRLEEIISEELASLEVKAAFLEYCRTVRPETYKVELERIYTEAPDNDAIMTMWALSVLDNARQNQAFLLGAKMPEGFEVEVEKCAEIFQRDIEIALKQHPPNKLLLPSQANNAAVSLRLTGKSAEAAKLLDRALEAFPELSGDVAQVRAVLYLQDDKDHDALKLIRPHTDALDLQVMASEIEAKNGAISDGLKRIDAVLKAGPSDGLRAHALATKARIGINSLDRDTADQALDELSTITPKPTELVLMKSAYERAFVAQTNPADFENLPVEGSGTSQEQENPIASLKDADDWDFIILLQTADELLARGFYRECTDLLRDKVSFHNTSPALDTLCDACLRAIWVHWQKKLTLPYHLK
jgi:tetratricopeptide (TPR) repeat protein